ncbi:ead/Ea22-like family protein [Salmonella enterica subsp. houtenae serovar 48:z4,z32:-]|uniref:Ead/Ea22-like family protein n=1 Tax=Salmonella enterica subsp. houtenae serovar 48:z4,z32:- TaxID=2577535 RepID=A0A729IRU5_SALHO|nr:ead/Ea22-like family protein [Salmonella enterica]EKR1447266.1 ead/Ea22-like family protein [Salmonella enterica subsp. houtenae serovar 48:z4,z32:-]HAE3207873.1 ead/Ea22-like family protein [Salmonella enterica subsp. houtenae serovar 48:z4,z32:-]
MSSIDKQALREEFQYMQDHYSDPADRERQVIYIAAEALLDKLEIKEEQRSNWFQMAQKLGEDLDAAEKRNAEQREYYEGVIADGSKRIAELEKGHQEAAKQINSWRRLAKQNIAERGKDISELEAARQRIAELEDAQCQHESDTLMLCHQFDELASAMGWTSELAMKQGVGQLEYARSIKARIAELEAKLETADKLQDGAFRDGLKAGFSYGQTDDQSGFAQCMSAYSTRAGIKVKGD